MDSKPKVLAIIPAYNEEDCIVQTVRELQSISPETDYVVINDGSRDATAQLCRDNGFNMIDLPVNSGLTVGFQTGMKYAMRNGYDYALQFDADGQHMPDFIQSLVDKAVGTDADIVIGSRFVTQKKSHSARMIGSRLITSIIRLTTGKTVNDPTSGMRMFNRRMIREFAIDDSLNPEPESISLLIRRGARVEEVQVEMRERQTGESYLNVSRSISYMVRACTSILFVQWFR